MNPAEKQQRFMQLLQPVRRNLERFAVAMTRNREVAKDIVGETILIAYQGFERLKNERAFLSYLFTIATRVARSQARHGQFVSANDHELRELLTGSYTPESTADVEALYAALAELPETSREAIIMFEIMGFSVKEIAEIQRTTQINVKVRLSRGRKRLKELLLPREEHVPDKNIASAARQTSAKRSALPTSVTNGHAFRR